MLTALGWGYIFQGDYIVPAAVFFSFYVFATLKEKGWLKTWQAVVLTLLPLLLVKLHLNNHWGMIGLSFMTFRALDVLLYRSKKKVRISCTISVICLCPLLSGRPNVPLADMDE